MTEMQKNDLVGFFCEYSSEEVVRNKQVLLDLMGVNKPDELSAIDGYAQYYKLVQEVADKIHDISSEASQEKQVRGCLKMLFDANSAENNEAINAIRKIMDARLYKSWSNLNQERYKVGVVLIFDWIHFFISYTNSSRPAVNNDYLILLKNVFVSSYIKDNKEKMNLVAALLYKLFKTQRLKTFYDKEILDWSDDFKKEIFDFTSKSFAFIQLVETEIFERTESDNYCYKEYTSYCNAISTFSQTYNIQALIPLCFYIISNPQNIDPYDFRPAGLPVNFRPWASDISSKQFITLHRKMTKAELMIQVQSASKKIVNIKNSVFENYLLSISS